MSVSTQQIWAWCSQCQQDRLIVEVMGGQYHVLSTCGHVVQINYRP